MKTQTLKDALQAWLDEDSSKMALAIALGLMKPDTNYETNAKHVISNQAVHPIGEMLYGMIKSLVDLGILEYRDTGYDDEYRWNPAFKGSWEDKAGQE